MGMKIAIFGYVNHPQMMSGLEKVLNAVKQHAMEVYLQEDLYLALQKAGFSIKTLSKFISDKEIDSSFDLFLSIGGDGTILRSVAMVGDSGVPVLGLNIGRLGFLANVQLEEFNRALELLSTSSYALSRRSLVALEYTDALTQKKISKVALNEITISRHNTTSMIVIEAWIGDEYLNAYWADGLIISTPTGSTGYSLSCGGPVISPETQALVITPIAPHNLNARPLIVPDHVTIKLKVSGREPGYLVSADSNIETITNETEIFIKKAPFAINLIKLQNDSFYKTIRKKLLWGQDIRN